MSYSSWTHDLRMRKMIRFSEEMDIALLRQVLHEKPFDRSGKGWKRVAEELRKSSQLDKFATLEARRARERTNLLLDQFKKAHIMRGPKSGEGADLTEKDGLLLELLEIKEVMELEELEGRARKNKEDMNDQMWQVVDVGAAVMQARKRKHADLMTGPSANEGDETEDVETLSGSLKFQNWIQQLVNIIAVKQEDKRRQSEAELQLRREELVLRREELAFEREKFEAATAERELLLKTLLKLAEK